MMFWLQISLPVFIAIIGASLLLVDSYNKKIYVGGVSVEDSYFKVRDQVITKLETQNDNSDVRNRLKEIGELDSNALGKFKYQQIALVAMASVLPFIGLFLMIYSFIAAVALCLTFGTTAYFAVDQYLSTKVKAHRFQIEAEFPAIVEMLTLAIAAGETPLSAFARIAERSSSKLAKEFSLVVDEVRSGKPFHEALDKMGRTLKSDSIRRFIDALVMAMVRGAPIVDVLYRHVAEARINQRNLVMDKAGKAETAMMIPIVFLILPISVLFALWPSINQLSFFAS